MNRILLLSTIIFLNCITIEPKSHQLLMFIHAHSSSFSDEEGLNVAHQMLTACIQKAAPILVSENIWQHVVLRRERFVESLKDSSSMQSKLFDVYKVANNMIKKHKDASKVNGLLHDDWYKKRYPKLATLESEVLKHLQFDFFCFYVFEYLKGFTVYRLLEGYLLFIPQGMSDGLCVQDMKEITFKSLQKPVFKKKSIDLHHIMKKYLCPNKEKSWCFYLTGHGYHKDQEHVESMVAGMPLEAFKKLLNALNNQTFTTKLLAYSSCYAAGEHAIISYQYDENGLKKDLQLAYPVLMMSLTDSPTYVFGVPSGFKLPPYSHRSSLKSTEMYQNGLQFYFLQNFNKFCKCARSNTCTITMARSLNPYVRCISSACDVTKVENIPLIRHAYQSCFVPLDKSTITCLTKEQNEHIEVKNKAALLWYVKKYAGTIRLTHRLPVFVSMIPASQVHYAHELQAQEVSLSELIRKSFLSIDDMHEQKIYLFDRLSCSINLEAMSKKRLTYVDNVMILTAGKWLPVFAQQDASCYVYAEHNGQGYWLIFNHDKELDSVIVLDSEQKDVVNKFKALLMQECSVHSHLSVQQLLSSHYFEKRKLLQQELLMTCLKEKICKD